jgi:hypothetical protein
MCRFWIFKYSITAVQMFDDDPWGFHSMTGNSAMPVDKVKLKLSTVYLMKSYYKRRMWELTV